MNSQSSSVTMGRFPFEYTEQQVLEIAKRVGPVVSVKLSFDPMTGKSKGNAVVTYEDRETAASAVRNLDYLNIPNGRFIRCNFTVEGDSGLGPSSDALPSLPLGVQLHSNQSSSQVISNVLTNIDPKDGLKILSEIKTLSIQQPDVATELLALYPQLAHALVELSLLTNTSNRDLIQLTVGQNQSNLREVTVDHANLLRDVMGLLGEDIATLSEDKQNILNTIRQEIKNGRYGDIIVGV